jgi:hypothetical protein
MNERRAPRSRHPLRARHSVLALATVTIFACAQSPDDPNTLTDAERAEGWRLLFDGSTLDGWRGYGGGDAPAGWVVEDGTLTLAGEGGDLVTEEQFGDFELSLEWNIEEGGNSGVFYRAIEGLDWIYQGAPEMQILDDANHADGQAEITSAGSNFGLHAVPRGIVRPAGEWNESRVVVRGDHVEHWLNGVRVVEYELGSDDWAQRVANSKFSAWPEYGRAARGHIGLQDHGNRVWFRAIKIRPLE